MGSAFLVQPCTLNVNCSAAKARFREVQQWRQDADVANAAYGRPPPKTIPAPANQIPPPKPISAKTLVDDPSELAKAGLNQKDLEIPETNFGAVVYKSGNPSAYTVSFRGTEEWTGSDMGANLDQALGKNTPYYSRAQEIARKMEVHNLQNGSPSPATKFVGHSLGGGLASAAAVAVDSDATTFNAAGLHQNTLATGGRPNGKVVAIHVKGEALTASQKSTPLPKAFGTRKVALDPPFNIVRDIVLQRVGTAYGLLGFAAAKAIRSGLLHKMGNVTDAIDRELEKAQKDVKSKCGG